MFQAGSVLHSYTSVQLGILASEIHQYTTRQQTISEHQIRIRCYLNLKEFADADIEPVKQFIFQRSCRLEQTSALFSMVEQYLKEHNILQPVASTLQRIIGEQRRLAREYIYEKITSELKDETKQHLNLLLEVGDLRFSALQQLKAVPQKPSPAALKSLTAKLEQIASTGVLAVDLSWLNNNYQRLLANYVKRGNAHQLRELSPSHRWAAVTCFLWQTYQDTIDQILDMHDKLQNKITNWAKDDLNKEVWQKRKLIQDALAMFTLVGEVILDDNISDASLRETVFSNIPKEQLKTHIQQWKEWITMKKSHRFHYVVKRFSYIRQFSKDFLENVEFSSPQGKDSSLLNAVSILKEMNRSGKRKLPDETPIAFIPKKLRPLVVLVVMVGDKPTSDDEIDKHAWECALLTKIRDEVKSSNLSVTHSKRFGNFDDFFIPTNQWQEIQESFFKESGLPSDPKDVAYYLTNRLNQAYDDFLSSQSNNTYANVNSNGWQLSTDPAEKLEPSSEVELDRLKSWLKKHMRQIKLPELLIEVDNELRFTHHFMPTASREERCVDEVCAIIATIMAHGSNVGVETMSKLIRATTYRQIQRITDWQLSEENQRSALAVVVNAIASLDTTHRWGEGKTSASDGQRFAFNRRVLHQTYSPKFSDFAIEFYSFIADNYAPFYGTPIECIERDAPYVLDGLLYNESDLQLEEHYTDTHGYTEINFAAFTMLGKRFCPRIRGLHKQRIYRIDIEKDYGILQPLINRKDRIIQMDWIVDQWNRMGQFYATLKTGHTTASVALKRRRVTAVCAERLLLLPPSESDTTVPASGNDERQAGPLPCDNSGRPD